MVFVLNIYVGGGFGYKIKKKVVLGKKMCEVSFFLVFICYICG